MSGGTADGRPVRGFTTDARWRRRRRRLVVGFALLGVAAALAVLPAFTDMEQYSTPADSPAANEGRFVDLPLGRTHYVAAGTGPAVILLHGLTGNYTLWDRNLSAFGEAFRTFAPDLFGRGLSERRPGYPYDNTFYTRQVLQFMDAMGLERAALVGLSMGGAVAIDVAAARPDRVSALVLVDSAGLPFPTPAVKGLVNVPGLGEYLLAVGMPLVLNRSYGRMVADPSRIDDRFRHRYEISARVRGYRDAILGSLRRMDLHGGEAKVRRIAAAGIPAMVVWGAQDQLVPLSAFERFKELLPDAASLELNGAGHIPQFEQPDMFNPTVVGFLERQLPAAAPTPGATAAAGGAAETAPVRP